MKRAAREGHGARLKHVRPETCTVFAFLVVVCEATVSSDRKRLALYHRRLKQGRRRRLRERYLKHSRNKVGMNSARRP